MDVAKLGADYIVNCSAGEDPVALINELTGEWALMSSVMQPCRYLLDTCLNLSALRDIVMVAMYKKPITADLGKAVI